MFISATMAWLFKYNLELSCWKEQEVTEDKLINALKKFKGL